MNVPFLHYLQTWRTFPPHVQCDAAFKWNFWACVYDMGSKVNVSSWTQSSQKIQLMKLWTPQQGGVYLDSSRECGKHNPIGTQHTWNALNSDKLHKSSFIFLLWRAARFAFNLNKCRLTSHCFGPLWKQTARHTDLFTVSRIGWNPVSPSTVTVQLQPNLSSLRLRSCVFMLLLLDFSFWPWICVHSLLLFHCTIAHRAAMNYCFHYRLFCPLFSLLIDELFCQ